MRHRDSFNSLIVSTLLPPYTYIEISLASKNWDGRKRLQELKGFNGGAVMTPKKKASPKC